MGDRERWGTRGDCQYGVIAGVKEKATGHAHTPGASSKGTAAALTAACSQPARRNAPPILVLASGVTVHMQPRIIQERDWRQRLAYLMKCLETPPMAWVLRRCATPGAWPALLPFVYAKVNRDRLAPGFFVIQRGRNVSDGARPGTSSHRQIPRVFARCYASCLSPSSLGPRHSVTTMGAGGMAHLSTSSLPVLGRRLCLPSHATEWGHQGALIYTSAAPWRCAA